MLFSLVGVAPAVGFTLIVGVLLAFTVSITVILSVAVPLAVLTISITVLLSVGGPLPVLAVGVTMPVVVTLAVIVGVGAIVRRWNN